MFFNYIKTAIRHLYKNKVFSIINITGLSIGIAACLLISNYVNFELSYDSNINNVGNLYRVLYERISETGEKVQFASASPSIGPAMKENFPEVEKFARAYKVEGVISFDDVFFKEENMLWAEPAFLELMSYQFKGNKQTRLLEEPNTAVISEKMASKYFGKDSPIGQTFKLDGKEEFQITGVFQNRPANQHYKADILLSYINWENKLGKNLKTFGWVYSGFYTYVKLKDGISKSTMDTKIAVMLNTKLGEFMERYKIKINHSLQPVKDIHLTSHYMHELRSNGNKNSVVFLQIIAWFIIIIAWINFVNLHTINSIKRTSEINIRKVLGGTSPKLILQFMFESLFINLVALLLSLGLIEIIRPFFSQISGIPLTHTLWNQSWFWYNLLVIFLIGTILAGSYPVWGILSKKMGTNLKGSFTGSRKSILLRKSLVVFQFFMALVLIAGTISVFMQLKYLQHKETGFNKDKILVVNTPRVGDKNLLNQRKAFKEEVEKYPFIKHISFSSVIPGKHNMFNRGGIYKAGDEPTSGKNYRVTEVDHDYINVYSNVLIAGRNFSKDFASDKKAVIVNLRACELLGFKSPEKAVNEKIVIRGEQLPVIGVIQNFHQESPRNDFEPQIFRLARRFDGYFSMKLTNTDYQTIQKEVKKQYQMFFPGNPFDYFYLNDFYKNQYKNEHRFGKVFAGFSLLALIITALGIMSLSSFTATQRRKEIGIRKAMGANRKEIVYMLSKSYIGLLLLSFVLSIPVIHYGLNQWLENFANRMEVSSWIFIHPLIAVALLSLITVSLQSFRAANENPVNSLRDE